MKITNIQNLECKKEEIRCNNITKLYNMINYDNVTKENMEKIIHIADKLLMINKKILIIGDSGCGKQTHYLN